MMRVRGFGRVAGVVVATVAVLAGCGGSQFGAPGLTQNATSPSARGARANVRGGANTAFTISGRSLLLNGKPFFIRGVDYSPTQINDWPDPNPLDDANQPIWSADLAKMRAAHINALKVYNISLTSFAPYLTQLGPNFKLKPGETGKIGKFLDAAWNNGNQPVYVVLSIAIAGTSVTTQQYAAAAKGAFEVAAKQYATYPAFMGFSIGNEINDANVIAQPAWWKGLNTFVAGAKAGYAAAGAQKITTTTMVDDSLNTVVAGEQNDFDVDVWGINSYRGYTFTNLFSGFAADSKKPLIISEYGYSSGYYPPSTAQYSTSSHLCSNYPSGTNSGFPWGLPTPRPWELIKELPATGNPNSGDLAAIAVANAAAIFAHSPGQGSANAVADGGFYFEWNDEWWKSGWPNAPHIGGEGNIITSNAVFPGCYRDESWFGLNQDVPVSKASPFPQRSPDMRVPRASLPAISAEWAKEAGTGKR